MSHPLANCPRCGAPVVETDRMCFACGQVLGEPGKAATNLEFESPLEPQPGAPLPAAEVAPYAAAGSADRAARVSTAGTRPPAWEERSQHGFWVALWLTWRDSVFGPVQFFRTVPPRSGLGPAIGYTLIITAVALTFNVYWETVRTALSGGAEEGLAATLLGGLLMLLLFGGFLLGLYLGMLFVMVALLHVGLMIVGSGRMGYEGTFRATAYASGPAAFAIFPFFGPILGMIWGSVVLFIAVREVQRTTNGRAAIAFLLPFAALFLFIIVIGVLFALLIGTADLTAV
ncbi:MAG TPA: YIP1 family protein [Gemmatimonadota bacterium]|nr:YIP1 family protein [Gemmatimonadota bacterium]